MNVTDIEQRITFAAVEPYFTKMREWALMTTVVPLAVVVVMWQQTDIILLSGWFLLIILGIFSRLAVIHAYRKRNVEYKYAETWRNRLLLLSAYLGLLWAFAIFTFFPESDNPHQIFLITLAVTLSVGSISAGTHWLPFYYFYGVPIMAALILRLLLVGSLPYIVLAAMMLFTLLASYNFARSLNAIVRSEMRLHYESEALARELQLKNAEAQEAVYAKSRILATASHDLRQPLHALFLLIDALKDETGEKRRQIFERIDLSLHTLRKMFDALFDMSRLDANVIQPEPVHFNIGRFLQNLYDEYKGNAGEKGLQLRFHSGEYTVYSDRILLERIMRNLISNALRYTYSGGVLIAARKRGEHILLQVWDTGSGIPRESQDRAFVEFQQLQNARQGEEKGLGFGLAIVRRLCELQDYPLTLSSVVGKGSVFSLTVPCGDPHKIVNPAAEKQLIWQQGGQKILVIDDDLQIRSAMAVLLRQWNFGVDIAGSAAEAIAEIKRADCLPNLILADFSLQDECDGVDAVMVLRRHFRVEFPAIIITGSTAPEALQRIESHGLALLQKPIQPAHLRSAIQHHLYSGVSHNN
ncbi:ATP-binding response regulator [Thalassolituus hydrocarboniclasticus]|uniref:histidine kinase n=1 Tax=Thalassolituus hydrocarboniclasticus TaxID=2742796 RepID=A0ABY6A874_9GAMM|nr:hybrid sensor histidine kinase/response regulator [Thalassolituus hydrocarboniclasticus]UXD86850.1 hybrid sensor histidine kinase/response regulator [Thalassolituus hydrocarboniclasticus]